MSCESMGPPPPGSKCINCYMCRWPPGTNTGVCTYGGIEGRSKYITTCKAAGPQFTATKEECEKMCTKPWTGATCYQCTLGTNEAVGKCDRIYPIDPVTLRPATRCPVASDIFTSLSKCKEACRSNGPIKPTVKCWSPGSSSGEDCHCTYGDSYGPDGPLPSCLSSQGNYDTEAECKQSCIHKKKKDLKWLWIGLGIGGAVLLLIIIIIVIIYFYKR